MWDNKRPLTSVIGIGKYLGGRDMYLGKHILSKRPDLLK